ncbi:DUF3703 domain-containing protein [Rhodococcus opacus]|uniref:DUF3703 domain-containing protein n=1 Tax=Rhodococcus opacus TaxID=37919 RepID=A0A076F641_RHOOP|nr:DUF3703 domain-containing protein [Rhodococcus opacus]AII11159.1 hypothetical protein EP51_44735 [Rhodococcus opacus]
MHKLTPAVRDLYKREMTAARETPDTELRWAHLERAHIVSQPHPWLHTRNHVAMFTLALAQHDRREALGQAIRIVVAAPGSLAGRYPEGNTGRTAAGLMTPMPIPEDLAQEMARAGR